MKFLEPSMEVILLEEEDIVTTSSQEETIYPDEGGSDKDHGTFPLS